MEDEQAVLALAALAQPTRLQAFRLLVQNEPQGLPAGELARLLEVPQNTLSAHLAVLARAGLVRSQRHSRFRPRSIPRPEIRPVSASCRTRHG
ncbi:MAG: metalloregulator ArsR/SmtB family transcription factor, partial [Bradyrhizobium sp.]|nr:metalloregulator ArsR/SmtB family transcription factor [Bradyrhizobium sp.]